MRSNNIYLGILFFIIVVTLTVMLIFIIRRQNDLKRKLCETDCTVANLLTPNKKAGCFAECPK